MPESPGPLATAADELARGGTTYPRAAPQIVTVRRGRLSRVTIRFDSGIR